MLRLTAAAGAVTLFSLPAMAGGFGCVGDCYTPTYMPPTYGTVTEKVMTRAPETYAITTPAQYKTVYDTVQVAGGGRVWSVTRDPVTGRTVGCWITRPAQYATVARTVMVSAPQVVPYAVPAQYGYRSQLIQTSPGYKAWAPIQRPVSYGYGGYSGGADPFAGDLGGSSSYGGAYGRGFGARSGLGGGYYPGRHHGGAGLGGQRRDLRGHHRLGQGGTHGAGGRGHKGAYRL